MNIQQSELTLRTLYVLRKRKNKIRSYENGTVYAFWHFPLGEKLLDV